MKIGILTQPLCNNYGGILQNYALQTYLKALGHDPVTLNIPVGEARYSTIRLALSCSKRFIRKLAGDKQVLYINPLVQHWQEIALSYRQQQFIDSYIRQITIKPPFSSVLCEYLSIQAYIVGSDQVWRPRYSPFLTNFFLDFTSASNVKRIAYAASFGVDEWEVDTETTKTIKTLSQQFDAISVRETSGVVLCQNHLNMPAVHVLDPTMLLTTEQYLSLLPSAPQKISGYIGVYVLDITQEKQRFLDSVSKLLCLPIKYIGGISKKDGFPSIESWLEGISQAQFVITDSFHGTVFSILFNRQFISISNSTRGAARFESLLTLFGLQERLVKLKNSNLKICETPIDFTSTNAILVSEREKAYRFLTEVLS